MDWLKAIYGVFGAEYPILSLVGATVLGAFMFGGAWWLVGREYRKEHPQTVTSQLSPQNREEDSAEKVSPDLEESSSSRDTSASAPSRSSPAQHVENNRSSSANVYQPGRDIIVTPSGRTQEIGIRSLTLEMRLTCVLKEPHGDLPPDEVPFIPVGDANAYLEGPAGRQRLTFSSPVRFRRLADNRINRFAVDPASDLINQPSHVLANYQNVIAPVITIVWGKEFEKFTLLELSLSLNGADPVYYSWPYDEAFRTGPVFTVGFENFKKKLGL